MRAIRPRAWSRADGGASWNPASAGLPAGYINALAVDPSLPARVFAGGEGAGLFRTTDGAANWSVANAGLFATVVNAVVKDPGAPAVLYAGTRSGVFKTTDGGASWSVMNTGLTTIDWWTGLPLVANVNAIAIDPANPSRLFAGTDSDVFFSTDGAATWTASGADGLRDRRVNAVVVAPTVPAAIYGH